MRWKVIMAAAPVSLALSVVLLDGAAASAQAATAPSHYSVSATKVGQLLADPAAADVLKRLIPTVYANPMFQDAGKDLALKDIQTYEPDALSDTNLAKIQAEFDKISVKR